MRRLVIFVCMVMFSGLAVMNVDAAGGGGGTRGDRMNFGSQGGTEVPEAEGEHGNFSDRIMNLVKEGKFEEALKLAQVVLNRQENRLGPEAPEVAGSLQRLANLEMLLQHWLKALTLYQRALQIREKVLGSENPMTADTLARLGRAYTEMGAYDKALPLVERSLAMIYQQQGDLDKARPLIEKAIKIKEKALGPTHPQTAKSQRILGLVQQGSKDYTQAEASFHKGQSGSQGHVRPGSGGRGLVPGLRPGPGAHRGAG